MGRGGGDVAGGRKEERRETVRCSGEDKEREGRREKGQGAEREG